jgi:hypothetical protein
MLPDMIGLIVEGWDVSALIEERQYRTTPRDGNVIFLLLSFFWIILDEKAPFLLQPKLFDTVTICVYLP